MLKYNWTDTKPQPNRYTKPLLHCAVSFDEVVAPDVQDKLRETARNSLMRSKHAAVVLDKKGNAICYAYNSPGKHAEVEAMRKYERAYRPRGWKAHSIVVIRINKSGDFVLSKPCHNCTNFLDGHDLRVYHS